MSAQDQINQLKKVKIPFWISWIGACRAWSRCRVAKKEVRYVATIFAWTHWTDKDSLSHEWRICKEDGTGRRSYQHSSGDPLLRHRKGMTSSVYADVIVPWTLKHYTNQQIADYATKSRVRPSIKQDGTRT